MLHSIYFCERGDKQQVNFHFFLKHLGSRMPADLRMDWSQIAPIPICDQLTLDPTLDTSKTDFSWVFTPDDWVEKLQRITVKLPREYQKTGVGVGRWVNITQQMWITTPLVYKDVPFLFYIVLDYSPYVSDSD
jgi:hypothetical protein